MALPVKAAEEISDASRMHLPSIDSCIPAWERPDAQASDSSSVDFANAHLVA